MSHILRNITVCTLLVFLVIAMPVEIFASASSSVPTAPVSVHFKPKSITVSCTDCSFSLKVIVKNKGSDSATATSCEYWFNGVLQKGCPLTDLPITILPHSKTVFNWSLKVGNLTAGTYSWKFIFLGTYNGIASKTHPATFTLIVTA